jgi:dihydrofolate synthase/folylpolyglutamate synthase
VYRQAERFIFSREFFGMKLGLENILEYLETLDNPQYKFKTVHIAGTNGKGSVASMIASIFREQGYRTGLYTSPHLVDFRERIQVNGEKIKKSAVVSFVRRHKSVLSKRKLTFFEVVTSLAFDYFAKENIEVAVIETGLGGRLDATNVLNPSLTITTDIDFDHTEILGNSIEEISREKAGIIKSGAPHLVGLLPKEAVKIFEMKTKETKSPLYLLSESEVKMNAREMSVSFGDNGIRFSNVAPSLYGEHQLRNTALVLKAAEIFRSNGLYVSKKAVGEGIKRTEWPGRFQIIKSEGFPTIVLDVAHNPGGIKAFVEAFKLKFPNRKGKFIAGFVRKKDHQGIFDALCEIAGEFAIVPVRSKRSAEPRELVSQIVFKGISAKRFGSLDGAWRELTRKAVSDDIICVVGSHYLVGEFLSKRGEKWPGRPDKKKILKERPSRGRKPAQARPILRPALAN